MIEDIKVFFASILGIISITYLDIEFYLKIVIAVLTIIYLILKIIYYGKKSKQKDRHQGQGKT